MILNIYNKYYFKYAPEHLVESNWCESSDE